MRVNMSFHPSSHSLCNESLFKDLNATAFASQVIAASYSMLFYLILLLLSALGVCFKPFVKLFSSHSAFILFLVGLIATSIDVFTKSNDSAISLYHRLVSVFLVGVVFILFGAGLFFVKPTGSSNRRTLGQHQPSMGLLVTVITLPLITTELLILLAAHAARDEIPQSHRDVWMLNVIKDGQYVVQKLIQVAVYVWLRNSRVCDHYKENAQFYFKVLAFFNFMRWVDAQVNLNKAVLKDDARSVYGNWFDVLYELYKALLIDYRLLCTLVFLEHSIQIKNETDDPEELDDEQPLTRRAMTSSRRQNRNIGFIVGICCLLAPFTCGLYYVRKLELSVYTRAVATLLNSFCILGCGLCLLLKNKLDFDKRDQDPAGVKIMVCCLGAVAFTSLMIKAALAEYWAVGYHDYRWAGLELAARGLTTLFLMVLYLKVHARALPLRNPDVRINHFLVPVLMLGIMAAFASSLVDEYIGPLDWRIRCEIKEESLQILHEAGLPMLLGFLIHVCLHFLFVQTRFGFIKTSHKNEESSPLLTSRSEFKDDQFYSERHDMSCDHLFKNHK